MRKPKITAAERAHQKGNKLLDSCCLEAQDCPASDHPGRIWSLLDIMKKYDISMLAYVLHEIDVAQDVAHLAQILGGRTPEQNLLDQSNKAIRLADSLFAKFPIGRCRDYVQSAKVPLAKPMLSVDVVGATFNRLKGDIISELMGRQFIKIADDRQRFAENDRLFGDAVHDRFESVREDVKESGNCLAVECTTAAVFHLMRVAEAGLRALARDRTVAIPKNVPLELATWEEIIRELEKAELAIKDYPKTLAREKQYAFFHGAMMEFRSFKNTYRNRVAHAREPFDRDNAHSVFVHVKTFMAILASRIGEDTEPTPTIWTDD